jgi:hypothetical protein
MTQKKHDAEKERYWQRMIGEAARSGMSIREFCRQRKLKEPQFYWWQRRLKQTRKRGAIEKRGLDKGQASFALVSDEAGTADAGIELVLGSGRRLRINKGVDAETLRAVLAALEP